MDKETLNEIGALLTVEEFLRGHGQMFTNILEAVMARLKEINEEMAPEKEEPEPVLHEEDPEPEEEPETDPPAKPNQGVRR